MNLTVSRRLTELLDQQDRRADYLDRLIAAGRGDDAAKVLAEFKSVQAGIRRLVESRARSLGVELEPSHIY